MNEIAPIDRAKTVLAYAETKARLAELAAKSDRIVGITNAAGYKEAQAARVELKSARIEVQRRGKDAREDATAYSKAVISAEKELVAIIEPEESRLQALQDAWDAEREAERQAKIRAEQERVEEIQKRIAYIRTAPAFFVSQTSDELRASIADMQSIVIGDDFAEFAQAADAAKAEAIANMETMIAAAEQRESAEVKRAAEAAAKAEADRIEAERIAAERAELERQRAELESQRQAAAAEQARIEAEHRARVEAEQANLRAQHEAAAKAHADAEAAQRAAQEAQRKAEDDARRAEIERQREAERVASDAAEAQAKAAREAAAAAESARIAAEIANATLRDAAEEALSLLVDLGEGEHITARKLAAALAKDDSKVQS